MPSVSRSNGMRRPSAAHVAAVNPHTCRNAATSFEDMAQPGRTTMKAERRSAQQTWKPTPWSLLLLIALAIAAQGSLNAGTNDWTNVGPVGGGFLSLSVDPQ